MKLRIRELREENLLTQKELAAKIDNEQRNVSNWEQGTIEPDCDTIVKLADAFNVSLDELFGRENAIFDGSDHRMQFPAVFYSLNREQLDAISALIESFKQKHK